MYRRGRYAVQVLVKTGVWVTLRARYRVHADAIRAKHAILHRHEDVRVRQHG